MDQIIEEGFTRLTETMKELGDRKEELDSALRSDLSGLLSRMATLATPLVGKLGNQFLNKSKQDGKGELYDTIYYDEKMVIIGRTDDPAPFRPDDMTKSVQKQFCVLTEGGTIAELMYSDDGFIIDSYLNQLTPEEAIELYGLELLYMLYRALYEYANMEEEFVKALEKTLAFIQVKEE
ncbi:hypothetical protein [Methanocalculus sp.]|uniref:hypothetical protein n=1 Tax=Methanocalculus sp. TaxID=2004547 RepID=UPI0027270444|nr:hypothetical protein [Methanocalculus sp.]MDO8841118.1 hypothetical protein [Methanocalculus sp.]